MWEMTRSKNNVEMIDYIIGQLAEISPARVVVECGGIGYEIGITVLDYGRMQSERNVKLYIHESIREDAHVLYGFLARECREFFRLLIGVSGVGPNTARLILSSLSVEQLESAIASGNDAALKSVKGIGGKTAQRIIVDLKDKIKAVDKTLSSSIAATEETFKDALAALMMLGFAQQPSQKALRSIFMEEPGISAEKAIKKALTML